MMAFEETSQEMKTAVVFADCIRGYPGAFRATALNCRKAEDPMNELESDVPEETQRER